MFRTQPLFCNNCGAPYEGRPARVHEGGGGACSEACRRELEWKWTLYLMGKPYYPQPREGAR